MEHLDWIENLRGKLIDAVASDIEFTVEGAPLELADVTVVDGKIQISLTAAPSPVPSG